MTVRTRFAPSPTGYLHIGGVRTALFNWLYARRHGGQFILRIDDTDQQRNVEAALAPILHGFRWLGLDWDEGPEVGGPHEPYFQSKRSEKYAEAVRILLDQGAAYHDYASSEEIAAERTAAELEKRPFVYSRRFAALSTKDRAKFEQQGRQPVVRLMMPREGSVVIPDQIRGDVTFQWDQEQDHVIQRVDGSCLYHLATVVDDRDFAITHVIRAEEHLSNTPRQVFIARQLGYELPEFAHMPFVAEPGSKVKLSKRKLDKYLKNRDFKALADLGMRIAERTAMDVTAETFNPVIVDFYEKTGFLPEAIVNYLLLLGWALDDRTEEFNRDEMIAQFGFDGISRGAASFDAQKLLAFQQRYMQRMDLKKKGAMVLPYLQTTGCVDSPPPCDTSRRLTQILLAAGDRITIAGDILDYVSFFQEASEIEYDEVAFEKRIRKPEEATELLREFREEPFEASHLEGTLKEFVDQQGIKIGQVIHALRVATTGKAVGFGMFQALEILGADQVLARIDQALELASR